jgi:DNA-binding FadR family transcriptional regulator
MFHKASQKKVFHDVISQIQESILKGKLQTGNRLPSERELSEIFKVSRGTLREALRVLEHKGLITIKTGAKGGAIVKDLTTRPVSESLDLLLRYRRAPLKDLAEFREGVEGMVANLAVERATHEDIQFLRTLITRARTHLRSGISDWEEFIHLDTQFHMALAHIAGNAIYESVLQTIYGHIHRYLRQYLNKEKNVMKEIFNDLCEILTAVEEGHGFKACLLVQNHVYRFNRMMEENAQKPSDQIDVSQEIPLEGGYSRD